MDLISVIIPVYNAEKYLAECLDSIINQDYPKIEIIIVDDGSLDASSKIADNYAQKNSNIKVYHRPNSGAHSSRIFGIKQSQGEFITFVDSDDKLPQGALSLLYANAQKYNLDIVLGASLDMNEKKQITRNINTAGNGIYTNIEYIKFLLSEKCIIGPACKIIKKEILKNISFELPKTIFQHEDLFMNILIGLHSRKIGIDNDINAYYYSCQNLESLSRGKLMSEDNWILLFNQIRQILISYHVYDECKKDYIKYIHHTIYSLFHIKGKRIFKKYNQLNISFKDRRIHDAIIYFINKNNITLSAFLQLRYFIKKIL